MGCDAQKGVYRLQRMLRRASCPTQHLLFHSLQAFVADISACSHQRNHILVEKIHIDIAEQLRGKVPDGKATALRRMEQALALRKPLPVCRGAPSSTIQRRVVKDSNAPGTKKRDKLLRTCLFVR